MQDAQVTKSLPLICSDALLPSQQFFSHVGTGLPGLNQYLVADKAPWSWTPLSNSAGIEYQTRNPSIPIETLPSHCAMH